MCLALGVIVPQAFHAIPNALIFKAGAYSLGIWISFAFVTAIPGIIIQLIIIPILVSTLTKTLN